MNIKEKIKQQLAELPDNPGVYLFYDKTGELIYVGKATSLRDRVKSYFRYVIPAKAEIQVAGSPIKLGMTARRPIEEMIEEVEKIKTEQTDSVLESAILEGEYIKKYRPKYNIKWRDDKSWNYIIITNDDFPKVKTVRERELDNKKIRQSKQVKLFGPYPGVNMVEMLRLLRKIFKISTCEPFVSKQQSKQIRQSKQGKPCFYYQLGQCLGVCIGEIEAKEYRKKVIHPLVLFLQGKKKQLLKNLEKEMLAAAKKENFEEAARLRNQIKMLQRIQDIALLNNNFVSENQSEILNHKSSISRIEGYDISNLGESGKVGSMVVFDENGPIKSEYKKFKIKTVVGQSDVDCLAEVLERRLKHTEWPLPDIFLIDGGKPQVNKIIKVLKEFKISRPIVGIAKGKERKRNDFFVSQEISDIKEIKNLLIKVRDEAHRFAINYQRKLRKI